MDELLFNRNEAIMVCGFQRKTESEIMRDIELDNMPSDKTRIKFLEKENKELLEIVRKQYNRINDLEREVQELRNEVTALKQYIHQHVH